MAAAQQINYWLTVRNWLIGWRIAEYEQGGSDRAAYGERLLPELAQQLRGVKGLAVQRLYDCRMFYREYPTILQTVSGELQRAGLLATDSLPTLSVTEQPGGPGSLPGMAPTLLLTRLSFSHFLELLALDRPLQRDFYEVQAVKNSWSVRELKRAINSALKPLRTALAVINGKWKLQILVALDTGHSRFGELKTGIAGISAKVLAKELKDLEAHQLIQRTVTHGPPVAVSYQVLPYARTLDPLIFQLRDWGVQHEQRLAAPL